MSFWSKNTVKIDRPVWSNNTKPRLGLPVAALLRYKAESFIAPARSVRLVPGANRGRDRVVHDSLKLSISG
jgi:hypothetical protein